MDGNWRVWTDSICAQEVVRQRDRQALITKLIYSDEDSRGKVKGDVLELDKEGGRERELNCNLKFLVI